MNFIVPLLFWESRHSLCLKFQLLCVVFWSGQGLELCCLCGSLCLVHGLWLSILLIAALQPAAKPSGSIFRDPVSMGSFWWAILQKELGIRTVPCTVTVLPLPGLSYCFHECACLPALPCFALLHVPAAGAWQSAQRTPRKWLIRWHKRHLKGPKMFVSNVNHSIKVRVRHLHSENWISLSEDQ